jgi:hypothetical protein
MSWSVGDFSSPEWFNKAKWKRRGWLGLIIAAITGLLVYLRYAIPYLIEKWPW